jgi:hypothetical protein
MPLLPLLPFMMVHHCREFTHLIIIIIIIITTTTMIIVITAGTRRSWSSWIPSVLPNSGPNGR